MQFYTRNIVLLSY